jgi:hypothetical protein
MHKGISSITKYYKNTYVGGLGANLQIIIIFLAFLSHIIQILKSDICTRCSLVCYMMWPVRARRCRLQSII